MKIVVIGGSGLIGSKLRAQGYEAVAASPHSGVAVSTPLNGSIEVAGPERFRFDELIRRSLSAYHDPREVVADTHARYHGSELSETSLVPGDDAQLGEMHFEDWMRRSVSFRVNQRPPISSGVIDVFRREENNDGAGWEFDGRLGFFKKGGLHERDDSSLC